MAANRKELSDILKSVMAEFGEEPHLYFQPPESVKLQYPCIIYHLRTATTRNANDQPYFKTIGYDVTYITRDPDNKVWEKLASLPKFGFDRYYTADGLHHYAFTSTDVMKEN